MSTLTWMFIAFMAVWVGIGLYLWSIGVRQRRLEERLESVSRSQSQEETLRAARRADPPI